MLILIHGDDLMLSRKALDNQKLKYEDREKIFFDGNKISLSAVVTAAESLSLFASEKLIIIENLVSGPVIRQKEEILDFLKDANCANKIILWEQKEIGKPILKKYFSNAEIIFCQIPPLLFKLLDSIGEKPLSQVLTMLHKLASGREGEFILSMLIRQWRYLIIAADLGEKGFTGLPSWQAYKFIKQARFLKLKDLISSYRQLLSCDLKVKMGLTPYSINHLLDIFLVSLYYKF